MTSPILITGGTGFVGQYLVRLLMRRGNSVALLSSSNPSPHVGAGIVHYSADIRNWDQVQQIVREVRPAQIYHLAGITAVSASWANPRETYEVNFWGACNLFEAAMRLPSPPKILNVSTSQVYAQSVERLTENSRLAPESPYAASKAMAELLTIEFKNYPSGGIVTSRPFNHSGPGQPAHFVVSSIAKQFAEVELGIRPYELSLGNIGIKRDFSDVRDVVEAYALLMERGQAGEIYNVCSGRAPRLSDVIKMFEAISGRNVKVETDPGKIRPGEPGEVCGSPEKIRAATGWSPRIPLETTLADLLDFWRAELRQPVGDSFN